MIEVLVQYRQRCIKNKNNDYFVYPYFRVKGHANNGTSMDNIKVCAGVSACVTGVLRLVDTMKYSVKSKSGLFEITLTDSKVTDKTHIDEDTNYALNTLLCQLYDIFIMYPAQFSKFDMIEIKGEENGEENKSNTKKRKPKPFRKLKQERLGFHAN